MDGKEWVEVKRIEISQYMERNIEFKFLSENEQTGNEYKQLLASFYNNPNAWKSRKQRMEHYSYFGDFRLVVAKLDGELVGQASAYRVNAVINGKDEPFYWGCDTFLLPNSRGLGLGKQLQKILHTECPNFSSAWYSPINGIIKRKCGASELMNLKFTYYPVSNFWGMMFQLASSKVLNKRIAIKPIFGSIYYYLNKGFRVNKIRNYDLSKVSFNNINDELSDFMESALQQYDFHIKRDLNFLKWAYGWKNDSYDMYTFKKSGKIEAMISYSQVHNCNFVVSSVPGVSILDLVISPTSELKEKDLLLFVIEQCKREHKQIECVIALQDIQYFMKFTYPRPSVSLLSTYGRKVNKGYISLIDQDMDQI